MTEVAISTDPRGRIFITPEAFADMDAWHATAAEIRRDEPVMRVEAEGWTPFWAITKHADVFEVSRRSDVFFNTEKSAPGPDLQYDMLQAFGIELQAGQQVVTEGVVKISDGAKVSIAGAKGS